MAQTRNTPLGYGKDKQIDEPRPQSADGVVGTPRSPLTKFCRDKLLSNPDDRLHEAMVHKIDLKEALDFERPAIVSRNPRSRAMSLTQLTRRETLDTDINGRPRSATRKHTGQRRLSMDEKYHNFQKAVDYFQKVKETNAEAADIIDRTQSRGSARRNTSTPCLGRGDGSGSRGGSKDSVKVPSRRGSKESESASRKPSKDKNEPAVAEESPAKGKARARFMAALGMPPTGMERKSILAMAAVTAMQSAGQNDNQKKVVTSAIGGSMNIGRNTLLQRLRDRNATVE